MFALRRDIESLVVSFEIWGGGCFERTLYREGFFFSFFFFSKFCVYVFGGVNEAVGWAGTRRERLELKSGLECWLCATRTDVYPTPYPLRVSSASAPDRRVCSKHKREAKIKPKKKRQQDGGKGA